MSGFKRTWTWPHWILHLIHTSTRYCTAWLIKTKRSEEIICIIFLIWIWPPKYFLSDNGGEFNNEVYWQMNEKLNVETCTTAAKSQFSNGIVERHNLRVAETMEKTDDEKYEPEIVLAWDVNAINALQNHLGHNLNELSLGFKIKCPQFWLINYLH